MPPKANQLLQIINEESLISKKLQKDHWQKDIFCTHPKVKEQLQKYQAIKKL